MMLESLLKWVELDDLPALHSHILFFLSITTCILYKIISSRREKERKKPPGPLGIPFFGYLPFLGKEPHKKLWKMREKYGDIIGLYMGTKYTVILNEFNVMKEVLSHPGALDRSPNIFEHIPHAGFGQENGEKWIEQRRFCLSTSRDLGLGKGHWEDVITEETSSFIEKLQATKGKPVDVTHIIAESVSSNIFSLLIGNRLNNDKYSGKLQMTLDYSDITIKYMGLFTSVIPGLRQFCEYFKIAGYDRALRIIQQFHDFIRQEISRHKTSTDLSNEKDFMSNYLEELEKVKSENRKHYFSETMLEGNVAIMFLGASDTIISSVGWLLRFMAKHKDIQNRVHKELMEVLGKDGRARFEDRQMIPYTFAVALESQRFSSIVPLSTTRRANQDIPIKNYIIPKGAEITANFWGFHFDQEYWDKPEEFRPERFLKNDGYLITKQLPSYVPFSFGRRNCPGETIAWIEILILFSEIIKNFEVTAPPGVEPEFKNDGGYVVHVAPQPLCFKERQDTI